VFTRFGTLFVCFGTKFFNSFNLLDRIFDLFIKKKRVRAQTTRMRGMKVVTGVKKKVGTVQTTIMKGMKLAARVKKKVRLDRFGNICKTSTPLCDDCVVH